MKILYAQPVTGTDLMAASGSGCDPGGVIGDDLTIACGEGALRLVKVQRAGGKVMEASGIAARLCPAARHAASLMRRPG